MISTSKDNQKKGTEADQRRFERIARPVAAICAYNDEVRRYEDACRTVNLSGGGVALEIERTIAVRTPVCVKLLVENRLLRCNGHVVRCDPPVDGDERNTIGIELDIGDEMRAKLLQFLQS